MQTRSHKPTLFELMDTRTQLGAGTSHHVLTLAKTRVYPEKTTQEINLT
jgi:hypothetical protein